MIYEAYQIQNISNHNTSKPNLGCIRVEQILYNVLITKSENLNKKYHKLTECKSEST